MFSETLIDFSRLENAVIHSFTFISSVVVGRRLLLPCNKRPMSYCSCWEPAEAQHTFLVFLVIFMPHLSRTESWDSAGSINADHSAICSFLYFVTTDSCGLSEVRVTQNSLCVSPVRLLYVSCLCRICDFGAPRTWMTSDKTIIRLNK